MLIKARFSDARLTICRPCIKGQRRNVPLVERSHPIVAGCGSASNTLKSVLPCADNILGFPKSESLDLLSNLKRGRSWDDRAEAPIGF